MNSLHRRLVALVATLALGGFAVGCQKKQPEAENQQGAEQQQPAEGEEAAPGEGEQAAPGEQAGEEQAPDTGAEGEQTDTGAEGEQGGDAGEANTGEDGEQGLLDNQQGAGDELAQQQVAPQTSMTPRQQVEYFGSWVNAEEPGQDFHDYASSGFALLGNSFNTLASQYEQHSQGQIQPGEQKGGMAGEGSQQEPMDISQVQQMAQNLNSLSAQLEQNKHAILHAQLFKQGAQDTVDTLKLFQKHPQFSQVGEQVQKIDEVVQKIDPNQPLAAQKQWIQDFFSQSAQAVDQISQQIEKGSVGGGPTEEGQQPAGDQPGMMDQQEMNQPEMNQPDMQQEQGTQPEQQQEQPSDQNY